MSLLFTRGHIDSISINVRDLLLLIEDTFPRGGTLYSPLTLLIFKKTLPHSHPHS